MAIFGSAFESFNPSSSTSTSGSSGGGGSQKCPDGYRWDAEKKMCVKKTGSKGKGKDYADLPAGTPKPKLFGPAYEEYNPALEEVPMEEMPVDQATAALLEWQKAQMEAAKQQARESAKAVLFGLLADYGLSDLENTVWGWIQGGDTEAASLIQRIRKEKTYQERFKGMGLRRSRGLNMPSEAEYIGLENTYRQIMRSAGLPANLFDQPDDLANLIGYDVSPAELNARIQEGYQAVRQSNPEVVNQMRRLYGVTEGELAAYFLDPERTLPMITRQARSAQIAGQAQMQAGQAITAGTAEELAVAGVTQEQAREGFQTIAGAQELFGTLAGTTEEAISAEEQIAGVFATSQAAQQRIRQRARERQSIFEQGGRFTGQGTTVTGLQ